MVIQVLANKSHDPKFKKFKMAVMPMVKTIIIQTTSSPIWLIFYRKHMGQKSKNRSSLRKAIQDHHGPLESNSSQRPSGICFKGYYLQIILTESD